MRGHAVKLAVLLVGGHAKAYNAAMFADRPVLRYTLAALLAAGLACAMLIFLRGEDPRKKILGSWQEGNRSFYLDANESTLHWSKGTRNGTLPYSWVQTEHEPYTLQVQYRHESILVDITFDGDNTALASPRIWEKLPDYAQQWIRSRNRAAGRPEKEFTVLFRRTKAQ